MRQFIGITPSYKEAHDLREKLKYRYTGTRRARVYPKKEKSIFESFPSSTRLLCALYLGVPVEHSGMVPDGTEYPRHMNKGEALEFGLVVEAGGMLKLTDSGKLYADWFIRHYSENRLRRVTGLKNKHWEIARHQLSQRLTNG